MKILLEAGPPMYLGFLIHLVLHFIIIQSRIRRRRQANDGDGRGGHDGDDAQDDRLLPIPLDWAVIANFPIYVNFSQYLYKRVNYYLTI